MSAFSFVSALAFQVAAPSSTAPSIEGLWRSPGGNSIIAIAACGSAVFCGTVRWATDKAKKDAAKSTNQLVGSQIITNLKQNSKGGWDGKLFIPDKKMHVTAKLRRLSADQLRVSGCAAGKALCRAAIWTAFVGSLPSDTSAPAGN